MIGKKFGHGKAENSEWWNLCKFCWDISEKKIKEAKYKTVIQ